MAAAIRWLDQSTSEQKRIHELVKLFQDRESRDELGLGQIRDVFSDLMFPGTSVLQTRAKYFLIVPWLFQSAPSSLSGPGLRDWVEKRERRLIATLRDAGVVEGLVGRVVGPKVKLLASSIYWNGLKRWHVVVGDPDIDQLSGRAVAIREGVDELAERAVGDWAASIPPVPDEFPGWLPGGFDLGEDEACWLRDQIVQAVPDSLLAHLVASDEALSIAEGPWDEPVTWTSANAELLEWVRDAERFSFVVRGAALVYNLLLIEAYRNEGFDAVSADVDHYRELLESWQAELDLRRIDIEQWDRGGLRVRVTSQNPRVAPATWAFVNRWIELALDWSGSLAGSPTARALIADRERVKKGRQARLTNKRLLQSWQGESSMRPLTYRWSNVQQIVTDIRRADEGSAMLQPDDRVVLTEMLRPSPGYRLSHAVCTTFTLDLQSALVIPMAFAAQRFSAAGDPIAVMEAVRRTAEKVDIFCQAGQIKVPANAGSSSLFAFLETLIHEVTPPRPHHLFHPKVWVVSYEPEVPNPESPTELRLLCLTRNLTADASWDVGLRLDGELGEAAHGWNQPLADLLLALPAMAASVRPLDQHRRARIEALADAVRRTDWSGLDDVTDWHFHALGIPKGSTTPDFSGQRRLVIAPFCNDKGLAILAPDGTETTVVAGARDLDRLTTDTIDALATTYVVSSAADLEPEMPLGEVDGEEVVESASTDRVARGGLHAKVTVVESGRRARVFVGSANATDAAYGGNVEFLVEIIGGRKAFGIDTTLGTEGGLGGILEAYVPIGDAEEPPDEQLMRELENYLRRAAASGWCVTLTHVGDVWDAAITTDTPPVDADPQLAVSMLGRPGWAVHPTHGATEHGSLQAIPTAEVSPFLVLQASLPDDKGQTITVSTVVRARLVNDPDHRLDEILANQIDTPEKLLRFLMLVLGLGGIELPGIGGEGVGGGSWDIGSRPRSIEFFEALVQAVAKTPDVFDDIASLIERQRATERGRAVLPEGFESLWDVVMEARRLVRATPALQGVGS